MKARKKELNPLFIFVLLLGLFLSNKSDASDFYDPAFIEDGLTTQQYLNYATELQGHLNFDACFKACQKVLSKDPYNARALTIITHSYSIQRKWDSCIVFGNKAIAADGNYNQVLYMYVFWAYQNVREWNRAKAIGQRILLNEPLNAAVKGDMEEIDAGVSQQQFLSVSITIFFGLLIIIFLLYYKRPDNIDSAGETRYDKYGLLEVLVSAGFVSGLLYFIFFLIAPVVRSTNAIIPAQQLAPCFVEFSYEHDGMEGIVLYAMTLLCVFAAYGFSVLASGAKSPFLRLALLFVFAVVAYLFLINAGFYPPVEDSERHIIPLLLVTLGIVIPMYWLSAEQWKISVVVCAVILIPICFVAVSPILISDASYILSPALRIMHGAKLSDIYFQYDLLLSVIALVGFKLNSPFAFIQHVAQFSIYALFLGMLLFSRKMFYNKKLAVLLLIFLVVVRFYGNISDLMCSLQVTPMRLDLWFIFIILVYWRGPYHWTVGLAYSLIVILHRNFGYIYLAGYVQLLFILLLVDIYATRNDISFISLVWIHIRKHFSLSWKNLVLIAIGLIVSDMVFNGFTSTAVKNYSSVGLGMIPVSAISFYWYVPVLLGTLTTLLLVYRNHLNNRYFVTGLFVVLLAAGNCIYFLGRSHENNLVNISAILSLALFLVFDLMVFANKEMALGCGFKTGFKTTLLFLLPFIAVLTVAYIYGKRVEEKVKEQYANILEGMSLRWVDIVADDFNAIRTLTNKSDSVYFLDFDNDFLHYYYGNYAPVGYFSPCSAFITKDALVKFMQGLLDNHYCIIYRQFENLDIISDKLVYNRWERLNGYCVIEKTSADYAFKIESTDLLHLALNKKICNHGMACKAVESGASVNIQCIVKPDSMQVPFATILDNSHATIGERGFSLLQRDSTNNIFIFSYGDNVNRLSTPGFKLEPGKWNSLTIGVNGNSIKIFVNGNSVQSVSIPLPIKGSNTPLWVGNRPEHDRPFNGTIREIKIANDGL